MKTKFCHVKTYDKLGRDLNDEFIAELNTAQHSVTLMILASDSFCDQFLFLKPDRTDLDYASLTSEKTLDTSSPNKLSDQFLFLKPDRTDLDYASLTSEKTLDTSSPNKLNNFCLTKSDYFLPSLSAFLLFLCPLFWSVSFLRKCMDIWKFLLQNSMNRLVSFQHVESCELFRHNHY